MLYDLLMLLKNLKFFAKTFVPGITTFGTLEKALENSVTKKNPFFTKDKIIMLNS